MQVSFDDVVPEVVAGVELFVVSLGEVAPDLGQDLLSRSLRDVFVDLRVVDGPVDEVGYGIEVLFSLYFLVLALREELLQRGVDPQRIDRHLKDL